MKLLGVEVVNEQTAFIPSPGTEEEPKPETENETTFTKGDKQAENGAPADQEPSTHEEVEVNKGTIP